MVNSIKLIENLIRNKHVPSSLLNTEGHIKEQRACNMFTNRKKYIQKNAWGTYLKLSRIKKIRTLAQEELTHNDNFKILEFWTYYSSSYFVQVGTYAVEIKNKYIQGFKIKCYKNVN